LYIVYVWNAKNIQFVETRFYPPVENDIPNRG
jgi:hypothetical protein